MTKRTGSHPTGPEALVELTKALADPGRLRIVAACRERELCACEIAALLDLAPSTVSRHLAILDRAGLVLTRREGRWAYVCRPLEPAPPIRSLLDWVDAQLDPSDPVLVGDRCCLQRYAGVPREELRAVLERQKS